MKIQNIIFSDGKIVSYEKDSDSLVIYFLDYLDLKLELTFINVFSHYNNDGVGYDLSDSRIILKNGKKELSLFDDDDICVFKIVFDDVSIKFLEDWN